MAKDGDKGSKPSGGKGEGGTHGFKKGQGSVGKPETRTPSPGVRGGPTPATPRDSGGKGGSGSKETPK